MELPKQSLICTKRERNKRKVKSKVLHPCKYCPVFFEGFCVPHTAGFCLPCFLASMVFFAQKQPKTKKPKLSSGCSTKQIRVDITTTSTTSATLDRSITCDLGNVTQKSKRPYLYDASWFPFYYSLKIAIQNNCLSQL